MRRWGVTLLASLALHPQAAPDLDSESMAFAPRRYICYRTSSPLTLDGRLDEPAWRAAPWSEPFIDIQGDRRPPPPLRTRVRMLWDDNGFYVGADMEEPNLWGTLKVRDSVIYQDNDFEVFIDPDGDTHEYYELEVNALATVWDLLLLRPYRDGGPPIDAWDIADLKVGIDLRGTLNRPGDRDEGWSVEIAMPWRVLREAAPGRRPPRAGDRWRVNFSRVEWPLVVDAEGRYAKRLDSSGTLLPEDNWVWSPQGAIDMHMPERWGFIQFSQIAAGAGNDRFVDDPNERVKWALRRLYYRQQRFRAAGHLAWADLQALGAGDVAVDGLDFRPVMRTTGDLYEITANGFGGSVVHIRQDGRVWVTR